MQGAVGRDRERRSPNRAYTQVMDTDHALKGILATNAATLVVAVVQQWSVLELMWPFWMQSVIIGYYARRRILALEQFSTEGLTMNDRPVAETPESKRSVANFFALHYGGFHAAYLMFLLMAGSGADAAGFVEVTNESTGAVSAFQAGRLHVLDLLAYLVLAFAFWRSHRASHLEHVAADLDGRPNLGTLMFMPYARVIPMHLTIVLAVPLGAGNTLWLFVLLKTGADVAMHKLEHHLLRSRRMSSRTTA